MVDFVRYVVDQVVNEKLSKYDAISLLRQYRMKKASATNGELHPLLHHNTSILSEQRFSSTFGGDEFFLANNLVNGQRVLSAISCLEMFRIAVEKAAELDTQSSRAAIELQDIFWPQPFVIVEFDTTLHTYLFNEPDGTIGVELYGEPVTPQAEPIIYVQGRAAVIEQDFPALVINISDQKKHCNHTHFDRKSWYNKLETIGVVGGLTGKLIHEVFLGGEQLLAKLVVPSSLAVTLEDFVLHPSILEGAMQAMAGILLEPNGSESINKVLVPVSLNKLVVCHSCSFEMWVLIHVVEEGAQGKKVDIDLCDDSGRMCAQLLGLTVQPINQVIELLPTQLQSIQSLPNLPEDIPEEAYEMMMFVENWEVQPLVCLSDKDITTLLCFASQRETRDAITAYCQKINPQIRVKYISTVLGKDKEDVNGDSVYSVDYNNKADYNAVFSQLRDQWGSIDAVLYLWALESSAFVKDVRSIVYILQALSDAKLSAKRVLLVGQHAIDPEMVERSFLESWIGFERSLGLILPDTTVVGVYLATVSDVLDITQYVDILWKELYADKAKSALYQVIENEHIRYVYQVKEEKLEYDNRIDGSVALRQGGTYLITGGCGGLGLLFAEFLAKTYSANLILVGRSTLNEKKQKKIQSLKAYGINVHYLQCDICDLDAMHTGIVEAKEHMGDIHGVLHAAGIESSHTLLEKEYKEFQTILGPKITGTLILDKVLQNEPLDFVCYFSSSSAILGDIGCCDYAVGNRFQMAYTRYRHQCVKEGKYQGKTIVINWPLWRNGGMGVASKDFTQMYLKSSGQRFIEVEEGLALFEQLLQQEADQHLVLVGYPCRVRSFLGITSSQPSSPVEQAPAARSIPEPIAAGKGWRNELKGLTLPQCIEWDLKEFASHLLKISRDRLHVEDNLAEFGFDSISLAQYAQALSVHFDLTITPAVFFGYPTLQRLTEYFHERYREALQAFYREESKPLLALEKVQKTLLVTPELKRLSRAKDRFSLAHTKAAALAEPIAIIGISGRFPQARTVEEMWTILIEGKDAVTEIPAGRFDWRKVYGDPQAGKTNCKWTGSIPGVAEFDPLFFEISPREATAMDPRQRLLLQESWRALEDAGYGATQINTHKIGVFVGVETGDYSLLTREVREESGGVTSNHEAILAARLSYVLNLSGPNMAINTACSSGLVAAHQACLSLRAGECDTALAAGVNILFRPEAYIVMSQAGMLSEDGKCYSFDRRANGMVPGEAVAVLVFKRLSQAETEGDAIYAVIKGSGVNYDGKTNGITAPSGVAQARLLKEVYDHYRINPERIEYIVTHGTGTKLGDPIEINALYETFKQYTEKPGYCALTSTKTNFGHTFAASGLVSLISLVKAMQLEMIPPSLHCEQENDYINWSESPFYVNKVAKPWPARRETPRLGAVSAFGMSGTNAHMVVESYESGTDVSRKSLEAEAPYHLLVLSAKTPEGLKTRIEEMIVCLQTGQYSLAPVCYTLLEGRQHFKYRCAIVIQDKEDAIRILRQVGTKEKLRNLFQGSVVREFEGQEAIRNCAQDFLKGSIAQREKKKDYQKILYALAEFYCQGYALDWQQLFDGVERYCVHLPTYPFARDFYWIEGVTKQESRVRAQELPTTQLHPLLHQNTSTLSEQCFSSTFHGDEFFLADHVVSGSRILPGVVYLEMVRAATVQTVGMRNRKTPLAIQFNNVVWTRPIIVGEQPVTVHIGLYPEESSIGYEVYSELTEGDVDPIVHSQGQVEIGDTPAPPVLDLDALRSRCDMNTVEAAQCYSVFAQTGLDYGPAFQGVETLYMGRQQVLAKLSLPGSVEHSLREYDLHPSLLDAALQASIGLLLGSDTNSAKNKPALPFALDSLRIYQPCTETMWAWVRHSSGKTNKTLQRLDIDLCNESGEICIQFKGFTARVLEGQVTHTSIQEAWMLQPGWRDRGADVALPAGEMEPQWGEHRVVLCEPSGDWQKQLNIQLPGQEIATNCISLSCQDNDIALRYTHYTEQLFELLKKIIASKPQIPALVQVVIPFREGVNGYECQLLSGLSGLLRTAHQENTKVVGQLIEIDSISSGLMLVDRLLENRRIAGEEHIRYRDGKRQVFTWQDSGLIVPQNHKLPWRDSGVYLITGGSGGLGILFATEIVQSTTDTIVILIGRSSLNETKDEQLQALGNEDAKVIYRQVDIADRQAVVELMRDIEQDFGGLNGIIHSAGVIRDNWIANKTLEELRAVLSPKVTGLVNLDNATQELKLDFLVLFSSMAAMGNVGQADYAAANGFMDAFAHYRNDLVTAGQRFGQTLSINWPLWKDGGMQMDVESERLMYQRTGVVPMQTVTGIAALYQGLSQGVGQVLVVEGDISRSKRGLLWEETLAAVAKEKPSVTDIKDTSAHENALREQVQAKVLLTISALLKVDVEQIDIEEELNAFGFDSISLTQLTNQLNTIYGLTLSPALLFEYSTVQQLVAYLVEEHSDVLAKQTVGFNETKPRNPVKQPINKSVEIQSSISRRSRFASTISLKTIASDTHHSQAEPIAIIGMSGCFPQAPDLETFWANLATGKDCISEVPKSRWDWEAYYGDPTQEENKTNIKWGGFIDGVDEFDPLFFGISPYEAQLMDPQQRLLMAYVWKAIEDAGYSSRSLSGTNTAIFVGTGSTGYDHLVVRAELGIDGYSSTSAVPSVGPNRMSYFLNIHGPSEPIETACSSSLVAIHRAVRTIEHGDCGMAIVGGVNTLLIPQAYISFNKAGMLCEDGRCKTFSDQANGYVRGEGVGMLVLKKLGEAEQAGDHIYGLIRGSAENHGGRANSLTAPNPKAQAKLLEAAYTKAGLDPKTITYIEAHGTGTSLGDPIEINGLKSAFTLLYQAAGYDGVESAHCGLGSVKTNIGHLELAAGVAGVIKVLLQLKHKTLVKSLHCDKLNPYIDFTGSPLYVLQEIQPWEALTDLHGEAIPRRAGVSSFGFGGVNAHVIIEEYISRECEEEQTTTQPLLIVLSAKNTQQLVEVAENISRYLENNQTVNLPNLAYTLQVGREGMEERLALCIYSRETFMEKLSDFIAGKYEIEGLYRGQVKQNKNALSVFACDEEFQITIDKWIENGKYGKLLDIWTKGLEVDWEKLYGGRKLKRISLPTYPFAKERYWVKIHARESSVEQVYHDENSNKIAKNSISIQKYHEPFFGGQEIFKGNDDFTVELGDGYSDKKNGLSVESAKIEFNVRKVVSEITKHDFSKLEIEDDLNMLGVDSIAKIKMTQSLLSSYPDLESESDLVLTSEKISQIRDIIIKTYKVKMSNDLNVLQRKDSFIGGNFLNGFEPYRKKYINIITEKHCILQCNPFCVDASLVVNENHPFFFDHPLDHVSGIQLIDAMYQICMMRINSEMGVVCPHFVSEVDVVFELFLCKHDNAIISVFEREKSDSLSKYSCKVASDKKIIAKALFDISVVPDSFRYAENIVNSDSFDLCDKKKVNKQDLENVFITDVKIFDNNIGVWLLPIKNHTLFSDPECEYLDVIYLMEACRQAQKVLARRIRGSEIIFENKSTLIGVLKSIKINLVRPLLNGENIFIQLSGGEIINAGGNFLIINEMKIISYGENVGSLNIISMALSERVSSQWREKVVDC